MRYCSSAAIHAALALSVSMFWVLRFSWRPESSRMMTVSPFLTSVPLSMSHLIVVALVLPLTPLRTLQMMSPFLADSRLPRATTVTWRIFFCTTAVGPVKGGLLSRPPFRQTMPVMMTRGTTAKHPAVVSFRCLLQPRGRGRREETDGLEMLKGICPPLVAGEGLPRGLTSDVVSGAVEGFSRFIDPHSAVVQGQKL